MERWDATVQRRLSAQQQRGCVAMTLAKHSEVWPAVATWGYVNGGRTVG